MKTFKKLFTILAIVLVAVMAFAPAKSFAEDETVHLTVTGPDGIDITGKTISVYKLFDIDENGNYSWVEESAAANFFKTKYNYTTVLEATEYVRTLSGTDLTLLAEEYYTYCSTSDPVINADASEVAEENKAEFDLTKGYYLVYDVVANNVGKSVAILRNLTDDTEVPLKIETIPVEKEADKTTANVGDTVNYTVTSEVPNTTGYTSYKFIVKDTLSEGLDFNNDVKIKIGETTYDQKVTVDGEEIVRYTVTSEKDNSGNTNLVITFTSSEFLKLTAGDEIVVTYSATVNSKAVKTGVNTNTVKIEYSNNPTSNSTGVTGEKEVKVYTYTVNFTKKNTEGKALNGAKFVLRVVTKDEDGNDVVKYATFDENGVFAGLVTVSDENVQAKNFPAATIIESKGTTTDDLPAGLFTISGLAEGTYTLVEIAAPDGYSLPGFDGFTFEIKHAVNSDGTLNASFEYKTDDNNTIAKGYMTEKNGVTTPVFAIDVLNAHEGQLPTTGGMGTTIFTIVGIVVMAAAVVALVAHNRKND